MTKQTSNHNQDREIEEYKDIPYAVIGHTSLLTHFSIVLTGESIKKIAKLLKKGEDLRIIIEEGGHRFQAC